MKRKMLVLIAALAMMVGLCIGQASAASLKLVVAHVLDTEHPAHLGFVEMDRLLKEKSGGQIVLEIFPNSQLGDEDSILNALRIGGSVDLAVTSPAPLQAYAKEFLVCDFPYAFTDYKQVWEFYDGEMGKYLNGKLAGTGIIGLAWWDNGFRNFTTTKKEIHVPADLKGMKMRTMNAPAHMAYVNALGAAATPIPYGELYSALQQGVVDGQENPVTNIYGSKFFEVQKYLIMDRHVHDPHPFLVSEKTWKKLSGGFLIVYAACRAAAFNIPAIRGQIEIRFQDFFLAVMAFISQRALNLPQLSPNRVRGEMQAQSRYLHGDRRASHASPSPQKHIERRAGERNKIDARMLIKIGIFIKERAFHQRGRNLRQGDKHAVTLIFRQRQVHQTPMPVQHHRGKGNVVQKRRLGNQQNPKESRKTQREEEDQNRGAFANHDGIIHTGADRL
ncbi:hypothetical protein FACS1894206_08400 [Deltaproteobacteria bacterium]|nr:hypothetical protein FACS1894206_08400 [Deltaproteobacteria bacterium]